MMLKGGIFPDHQTIGDHIDHAHDKTPTDVIAARKGGGTSRQASAL